MSPPTAVALEPEDKIRDAEFAKAMHKNSAKRTGGFAAMLSKDKAAHDASVETYYKFWEKRSKAEETEAEKKERVANYATLTRHYYNLATDLYENGWGQSFHFCRFYKGEGFYQGIARHEHYLAKMMGITADSVVLDVGCGVGGPAREICRFTDANIVGLNNNDYQIARATEYAYQAGLSHKLKFMKGDFMQMSYEPNTFDFVYAIEATVHAPSLEGVYGEIYRSLKPGGVFGVYEWLMTDNYDETNPHHREICHGIEHGNGISNMVKIDVALQAMKNVGFELLHNEDLADRDDPVPWYYPIAGEMKHAQTVADFFTVFRMTRLGRGTVHKFIGALETIGVAPTGTQKTADSLSIAADNLVAGAKEKIFTPMYLMIGRKPLN